MSKAPYLNPMGLHLARRLAEQAGFTLAFLQGKARHANASHTRAAIAWELARQTSMSLPEIGAILGKDHTSVLHMIRAENERRGTDVRGFQFPDGYRERNRLTATIYKIMSREVLA